MFESDFYSLQCLTFVLFKIFDILNANTGITRNEKLFFTISLC